MSPKLPRVTAKGLLRALNRDGWYEHHQVGSHLTLKHRTKSGRVVVPVHTGEVLRLGLLSAILADAQLSPDDLRRLL